MLNPSDESTADASNSLSDENSAETSPTEPSSERSSLIGPPKLTRFEKARIVGARALQISMGAPILIEPSKATSSPIDIAIEELKGGVLPMTIRRTLPDGVTFQDIPVKWLL